MKKLPTPTQIMDYSDEELDNFYVKLTKEYKGYFYQKSSRELAPVFNQVLKKSKVKNGTQITNVIRVATEEKICRLIMKIATIQYLRMEKSEDYGELGEQRVVLSYCRMLLNVPSIREVSQNEIDAFHVKISELQRPIEKYSVDRAEKLEYRQKIDILGKIYDFFQDKEINELLKFLGSEKRMIVGYLGNYRSILYGVAEEEIVEGYTILRILEEEARTPANVLSIAAVVGGKQVAIRYESCETIFANKWRKVFLYGKNELRKIMSDEYGNIGESFKLKALEVYKAKDLKSLDDLRKKFIAEMVEGLLIHELGHGIVINDLLNKEEAAFGEALGVLGNNLVSVQKEILADWAPAHGKLKGPLQHFADMAAKDKNKAARMLYVYLSDNWFLGTSTDNFNNHTDILISLLLPFMKANGSFDFPKLKKALKDKKSIFNTVLKDYKKIVSTVLKKVSKAKYTVDHHEKSYNKMMEMTKEIVKKEEPGLAEDSVEFLVPQWAKILSNLQETNPQLLEDIDHYVKEENKKYKQKLMSSLGGGKAPSLREKMIDNLKKNGFSYDVIPITIQNAFQHVMKKYKYSGGVQKDILEKLEGVEVKGLNVVINYEVEPDPFIEVFQTILEKSGLGNINSHLEMGEDISMDDSASARKISFNAELNNLIRSLRDNFFTSIKELKVNKRYAPANWSRGFLKKMKLYNGKPFINKVSKVTYEDFKPSHIFEVFIPVKKGYWDWNTVHAVQRINKQLRPYAFDGHHRVDRLFLDAMAEEYFATMNPLS